MTDIAMLQLAEFSRFPGGALATESDFSGEEFREKVLLPALKRARTEGGKVLLNLDGVLGLSSAFSREAFGGLVTREGFTAAELRNLLVLIGHDPGTNVYRDEAWSYIEKTRLH